MTERSVLPDRAQLPIHIEAFLRETAEWPLAAVGAHVRLLCHAWENSEDGSLPDDPAELSEIVRVARWHWSRWLAPTVLKLWPRYLDNRRRTKMLENIFQKIREFSEIQRSRAKKRWEKAAAEPVDKSVDKAVETCGQAIVSSRSRSPFQNKKPNAINGATHAMAMPNLKKESEYYSTVGASDRARGKNSSKQEKKKNGTEARAGPARQNNSGGNYFKARSSWEAELARKLGPAAYAEAVRYLATDQPLCERATAAEQRKPGSGVLAALVGLRQYIAANRRASR